MLIFYYFEIDTALGDRMLIFHRFKLGPVLRNGVWMFHSFSIEICTCITEEHEHI